MKLHRGKILLVAFALIGLGNVGHNSAGAQETGKLLRKDRLGQTRVASFNKDLRHYSEG